MCQWKFFVFRYKAKRSASSTFRAPDRSRVASAPRSDGVLSCAARRTFASSPIMMAPSGGSKTKASRGVCQLHARDVTTVTIAARYSCRMRQAGGQLAREQCLLHEQGDHP